MALFNTIEEIREFIPINIAFTIEDITPLMDACEVEFIQDILGEVEYVSLENNFQDNTLSADQETLLFHCRKPLAWLMYAKWVPMGNVNVTAGGFQVAAGSNMAPASQWRVNDFEHECYKNGYNNLELLLYHLWTSDAGTYPDWEESAEHDAHREFLILSAKEIQRDVDINSSVEIFRKLKPFIKLVEENHILPITGQELYDDLKDDVLNDTLSANNEILMKFIRPCISNYAMANGVTRIMLVLESYGILQLSKGDKENINVENPADKGIVSSYMQQLQRTGQLYENKLREYLKNNASTYPLYAESSAFEDIDDVDSDGDERNDQDSGFYRF